MKIRQHKSYLFIIMFLFIISACRESSKSVNPDPGLPDVNGEKSSLTRNLSPEASLQDMDTLVKGNNTFALDMYHSLCENADGNIFYSPYSISLALAMTYAGAKNETALQMADTLHFTLSQNLLHPAFNALDLELASRTDSDSVKLNIANSLWGQDGYPFLTNFLDTLALNYGADLKLMDFETDPDKCRTIINDWVSINTQEKISDLIPEGGIDPATRLFLANAIYFYADWANAFDEKDTRDDTFYLLDKTEITVPMMSQENTFSYMRGDEYQAIELPYKGDELSMVIILPDTGKFSSCENTLSGGTLISITENLIPKYLVLKMPRFEYTGESIDLSNLLSKMGMLDAFDPSNADFSGIIGQKKLFIQHVFHKAYVKVNEKGTEAAAATGVGFAESVSLPEISVTVDRPFIFLIRDIKSGAILFFGRIVDPLENP